MALYRWYGPLLIRYRYGEGLTEDENCCCGGVECPFCKPDTRVPKFEALSLWQNAAVDPCNNGLIDFGGMPKKLTFSGVPGGQTGGGCNYCDWGWEGIFPYAQHITLPWTALRFCFSLGADGSAVLNTVIAGSKGPTPDGDPTFFTGSRTWARYRKMINPLGLFDCNNLCDYFPVTFDSGDLDDYDVSNYNVQDPFCFLFETIIPSGHLIVDCYSAV